MRHAVPLFLLLAGIAAPLAAQDAPSLPNDLGSASAIGSAAQTLAEQGGDRLLIRDLLGTEMKGADGDVVGTVEDFAVVPGGRVVAAILSSGDGSRIAVPFAAVKLAESGSGLTVPVPASELDGMSELQSLAESLTR